MRQNQIALFQITKASIRKDTFYIISCPNMVVTEISEVSGSSVIQSCSEI